MKKRTLLLGVIAALPVLAQEGWKLGLNVGAMKANVPSPFSLASYSTSSTSSSAYTSTGQQLFAEYGNHIPLNLSASYRKGSNEFGLDVFYTNKAKNETVGDTTGNWGAIVWPMPIHYETKLRAMVLDFKWIHHFQAGEHGAFNTTLGLRYGSFKHDIYAGGFNAENTSSSTYWYSRRFNNKTNAYGILTGIGYSYPFNNVVGLGADFNLAFVQGTNDSSYIYHYYYPTNTPPLNIYQSDASEKNQVQTQTDLHVHLDVTLVKNLQLSFGYRYINFGKVDTFSYGGYYGTEQAGGWGLNGFTLGASVRF